MFRIRKRNEVIMKQIIETYNLQISTINAEIGRTDKGEKRELLVKQIGILIDSKLELLRIS